MFSFKKSLLALVGLFVIVGALATLMPLVGRGQGPNGPPPQDVIVINSAAQPVPVTGTVNVANRTGAPLRVRDVDNPARQPVQAQIACVADNVLGCSNNIYTVPQGKRLIIEFVSMEATLTSGQVAQMTIRTTAGGADVTHRFPLTQPAVVFQGESVVAPIGQQVRLYADAGTTVEMAARRNNVGAALLAFFRFSISGNLVDVP